MSPCLAERVARLEQRRATARSDGYAMPPGLYEHLLCDAVQRFIDYPNSEADTLNDGLARLLGYNDLAEADATTATAPEAIQDQMATLWPRLVERYAPPGSCGETAYDHLLSRTWAGILGGAPPFKDYQHKTSDAFYGPNQLIRFDYSPACVRAAFAFYGTTVEEVEADRDEFPRSR
ncbi:hypothetical protein MKK69_26220 [Methylobacterium sp. J-026]|uniref:hypothetical protein n=1 Tax=Methylobacterium sp. J-026 TaxID=2836624 RepID=UPI001FBA0E5A|nr:hypothetical protein [Methylobacterium sp. J-026]MCJ2137497.1 hypothetical protein [Methylobacterium sp. J-026]